MKKVILATICLALASPAIAGSKSQAFDAAFVQAHVIKGQTTIDQIREMFGKPDQVQTYSDGKSDITYRNKRSGTSSFLIGHLRDMIPSSRGQQGVSMAAAQKSKSFTVSIDAKGIVSRYTLNE